MSKKEPLKVNINLLFNDDEYREYLIRSEYEKTLMEMDKQGAELLLYQNPIREMDDETQKKVETMYRFGFIDGSNITSNGTDVIIKKLSRTMVKQLGDAEEFSKKLLDIIDGSTRNGVCFFESDTLALLVGVLKERMKNAKSEKGKIAELIE